MNKPAHHHHLKNDADTLHTCMMYQASSQAKGYGSELSPNTTCLNSTAKAGNKAACSIGWDGGHPIICDITIAMTPQQ